MFNAIINNQGAIIGCTTSEASEIDIAGAVTADGAPVNVRTYKVSKSKKNRSAIDVATPVAIEHSSSGREFFTLEG